MPLATARRRSELDPVSSVQDLPEVTANSLDRRRPMIRGVPLPDDQPYIVKKSGGRQPAQNRNLCAFAIELEQVACSDHLGSPEHVRGHGGHPNANASRLGSGATASAAVAAHFVGHYVKLDLAHIFGDY